MEARKKKHLKENLVGGWFTLTMMIICCEPVSDNIWPLLIWGLVIIGNLAGIAYVTNKMYAHDDDNTTI